MLFSFVRSTQRVVSIYINEFLNDMNTDDLDRQHFVDKVLAGKLFQIAGWGTISVSFMTSLVYVLQCSIMISFIIVVEVTRLSTFVTILRHLVVTLFIIIQVFTILPSILYCTFLIMLWLYFRDRTKVKYSGYSSDDPKILKLIHSPKQRKWSAGLYIEVQWNVCVQSDVYDSEEIRICISNYKINSSCNFSRFMSVHYIQQHFLFMVCY